MRLLALTFDASGNLPPLLGLIEALTARGHHVLAMGHDTQRDQIEAAGADVLPFKVASQRDAAAPVSPKILEWLPAFDLAARDELLAAAQAHAADVLIVDALLSQALAGANASAWRAVGLEGRRRNVSIETPIRPRRVSPPRSRSLPPVCWTSPRNAALSHLSFPPTHPLTLYNRLIFSSGANLAANPSTTASMVDRDDERALSISHRVWCRVPNGRSRGPLVPIPARRTSGSPTIANFAQCVSISCR